MKKFFLYTLHHLIARFALRWILGIRFHYTEHLSKYPQFILVGNHNSHLDTVSILSALPVEIIEKVHPVAAADYFGTTGKRAFWTRLLVNAILIPRKRPEKPGDPDPLLLMEAALERGDSILLFPEGSRGIPEVIQPFRKGVGHLLKKYPEIPYIPVYMQGLGRCLPKGRGLLLPLTGEVIFGEPRFCQSESVDSIVKEVEFSVKFLDDLIETRPNWDRMEIAQ
ncbi:MAG: lysophospholipid acyltransferase family protein [Bacteroidia bacterium]|nr:lysophospholipid acyltransferase family protein [Bacteroidia bacterium]